MMREAARHPQARAAARDRDLGFCRSCYFAFYVIEHYVDPGFRFSGLGAFVRYLFARRKSREGEVTT